MGVAHVDELSHHGILGQKWGVRRYQNKDGSLTSAGKAHRDSGSSGDSGESSSEKKSVGSKVASAASKTVGAVSSAASKTKEKVEEHNEKTAAKKEANKNTRTDLIDNKKKDAKTMSDAELRQAVNRLQLERTYADLMNQKSNSSGSSSGSKLIKSGTKYVADIFTQPASDIAKQAVRYYMGDAVNNAVKKSGKTTEDIVNPRKTYKNT